MEVDDSNRVVGFVEKSPEPKTMPGDDEHCFASMGIYVFNARFLYEQLCQDATLRDSSHDFGKNIIPSIIDDQRVFAFPFRDENRKGQAYWRDVGTIDAYYQANMDLVSVDPQLNMYDREWPIRTFMENLPPPKFVFGGQQDAHRVGRATDSVVCQGAIVSGGDVSGSILSPGVRVNSYAQVEDSILLDDVSIGRHAKVRRAIIDKGSVIPEGVEVGFDLELDRKRGFTISDNGIVVIAKGEGVDPAP